MKTLGIVAGNGILPEILINNAKNMGWRTVATTFGRKINADKTYTIGLGQVKRFLGILKDENIKHVVFAGKVEKKVLFGNLKLDFLAIKMLASLKERTDAAIMRRLAEEIEKHNAKVLSQAVFLKSLFAKPGILTKLKPAKNQLEDIKYGTGMAKKIAALNIGQSIVVKNKTLLAVESIEGTDNAIIRGGKLGKKDAIVLKVCKKNHDMRFDIPTVGIKTLRAMLKVNSHLLAIEAGKTLIVNRDRFIKFANDNRICVIAI